MCKFQLTVSIYSPLAALPDLRADPDLAVPPPPPALVLFVVVVVGGGCIEEDEDIFRNFSLSIFNV